MKSIALSTTFTASTSAIAFCQGKNQGNDDNDDVLSKIKSTITSSIDLDAIGKSVG